MKLFVPALLIFVLLSCGENQEFVSADFELISKFEKEQSLLQRSENAQELGKKVTRSISAKNISYEVKYGKLHFSLSDTQGGVRFEPKVVGLPKDWKQFEFLKLSFSATSKSDLKIAVVLWSHRGRMADTLRVSKDESAQITIDLHDLPLIGSVTEKYDVREIQFLFEGQANENVELQSLDLTKREGELPPVVDKFGQRLSTSWPGKMKDEKEFVEHLAKEQQSLGNKFSDDKFDKYHGVKGALSADGTGYFRLGQKITGRDTSHFFITPEGNPFWSFGATCIRPTKPRNGTTLIQGNEQLFQELPDRNGPYADAYVDTMFSFYNTNILKKYGNLEEWRNMVYKRLDSWGINTLGNWSEEDLLRGSQIPFTHSFLTDIKLWKMDVYDPKWEAYIDSVFAQASDFKDNPYLLGYFVDNEAGWGHLGLLKKLPLNAFTRKAWVAALSTQFEDIGKFNENRGTNFSGWDELKKLEDEKKVSQEDIELIESLYADKYFGTIRRLIKKHDPNHLYLGCRFTRKLKPDYILRTAGKYCDAVTVNVYSYEPIKEQMDAWHNLTGKPILIGEHQAALKSPRQLPLRWRVFNEAERFEYFTNYVSTWAKMPYSLGSHWYQFADQHVTGRASNGENQIIGFVDITDQTYDQMVKAAQYISDSIYHWHGIQGVNN
ncbi:MAG: hypothetical protein JXQ96_13625 [Cyclobacteriaceae bacterium]